MSLLTPSDKKRLSKNPFKAPSPILKRQQQQKPLNFFLYRSKSSLENTKKSPDETHETVLNTPISKPKLLKTNSLQELTRSSSFFDDQDDTDDDLVEIKNPIKNFKNSKPLTTRSYAPPTCMPPAIVDLTASELPKPQILKPFKPLVSLSTLSTEKKGQQILSFGNKSLTPTKRPLNPWDQGSRLTKTKNPRVEQKRTLKNNIVARANPTMVLSDEQKQVIELVVKSGHNVFYTGSAGTGKSVLLRELVAGLRAKYGTKAVAITASTGLAAVNIGGSTINRLSGMGIGDRDVGSYVSTIKKKPELRERWRKMKVLIIDEISMLDGSFLDKLDRVARGVRLIDKPFGGIQMVLTGDFFQLPPVPDKKRPTKFCFQAEAWKYITKTILLHKVFRQADAEFVDILNSVRLANVDQRISQALMNLSRPVMYEEGIQPTELYCTRNEVEYSNRRRLAELPGDVKKIVAQDTAPDQHQLKLLDNTMAVKELELKIGAQVMMLKNVDDTLVNGSVGIVIAFLMSEQMVALRGSYLASHDSESGTHFDQLDSSEGKMVLELINDCNRRGKPTEEAMTYLAILDGKQKKSFQDAMEYCVHSLEGNTYPVVRFTTPKGGRVDLVAREEFPVGELDDSKTAITCRVQVPLLLSWALSIHKAQGQTLNYVKVDLNKVFEAGQVYVALSRAVSKENLQILNFHPSKIRVNPEVKRFYETLEKF
jgi:ATP-dependent DNA helicase PIF1